MTRGDPESELLEALEDSDLERTVAAQAACHRRMAVVEEKRGHPAIAEYHRRMAGVVFCIAREIAS